MASWASAKPAKYPGAKGASKNWASSSGAKGNRRPTREALVGGRHWGANAFVESFLDAALEAKAPKPQAVQFRPSSFPYCAVLHAFGGYVGDGFMDLHKEVLYSFDFYTAVGTAVHTVIQTYAAHHSRQSHFVLAVWKCSACGHESGWQTRPGDLACPACDRGTLGYEELTLKGRNISGHADMVLCEIYAVKSKTTGAPIKKRRYHLLEFKTTSEETLRDADGALNPKGYLPQEKHTVQVGIYAAMLARHGYKVSTISLIYISRDKAAVAYTARPGVFSIKVDQDYLDFFEEHLARAENAFEVLTGHAAKGKAFDPKAFVAALWKQRPCQCSSDYTEYMKLGFFRSDCPFGAKGLCWGKDSYLVPRMLYKDVVAKGIGPLKNLVSLATTAAPQADHG